MIWSRYQQFQSASYFLTNFGKGVNEQDWITNTPVLQWAVWLIEWGVRKLCVCVSQEDAEQADILAQHGDGTQTLSQPPGSAEDHVLFSAVFFHFSSSCYLSS